MNTKLIFIFLLFSLTSFPQGLQFGFGGGFSIGNKNLDYQFGPSIIADYTFYSIPVFIRVNGGYYLSSLNSANEISWDPTNNLVRLGISAGYIYKGVKNSPYIGLGCNYDINSIHTHGNPARFYNGSLYGFANVKDNLSYEIKAGVKFFAKSKTSVIIEVSRIFCRPEYERRIFNMTTNEFSVKQEQFDFNTFILKVGVLFAI